LPAPIVNGGGDIWKRPNIQLYKGLWPWPWIGSYCIPSCITHRPLTTCQISLKSKKLCGRTDVRRYVHTDGRTFETGFIKLTLSKSRPTNAVFHISCTTLTCLHWHSGHRIEKDDYSYICLVWNSRLCPHSTINSNTENTGRVKVLPSRAGLPVSPSSTSLHITVHVPHPLSHFRTTPARTVRIWRVQFEEASVVWTCVVDGLKNKAWLLSWKSQWHANYSQQSAAS